MAFDPYNLVMGPDGAFHQAEDVTMRGALDTTEAERLARYRAAQAAQMEAQLAREAAARGATAAPTARNAVAGAARGARGGILPAVTGALGAVAGPVLDENYDPRDAGLYAAGGYGAGKALQVAAPYARQMLPAVGGIGNALGGIALAAPAVWEGGKAAAGNATTAEEAASNTGILPSAIEPGRSIAGDAYLRGANVLNTMALGIPGAINRLLNRWQYGDPVEAAPRPALEPAKAAAPAGEPVGTHFMRGAEPAAPVAPSAVPAPTSVAAPQAQPALAPSAPAEQTLMPQGALPSSRMDALMSRLENEAGQVSSMFEDYQKRSGSVVPQNLNAMDKWTALAKGLGAAALMSAFPGFGLLASLGIGGLVGTKALEKRKEAYQRGALQEQKRLGDVFGQGLNAAKERRGALSEVADIGQAQQTFEEGQRQFNQNYALNAIKERRLANQASIEGAQLKQAANGEYLFMYPNGTTRRTGQMGPLVTQGGQRYSVPGAVTGRMEALSKAGADPATLYQTALQQVTAEGGGAQLLPGVAEALAQY